MIKFTLNDPTVGRINTLQMKAGVLASEVVLRQAKDLWAGSTDALEVSVSGTTDKVTFSSLGNLAAV